MTTQAAAESGFFINRLYMRDLSFENPDGPAQIAQPGAVEPKLDGRIKYDRTAGDDDYVVDTLITLDVRYQGQTILMCEIAYVTEVTFRGVPEAQRPKMLSVDVPNLLLPQMNELFAGLARAAGYANMNLGRIDFLKIFEDNVRAAQREG